MLRLQQPWQRNDITLFSSTLHVVDSENNEIKIGGGVGI
jgi:hypothetical protein